MTKKEAEPAEDEEFDGPEDEFFDDGSPRLRILYAPTPYGHSGDPKLDDPMHSSFIPLSERDEIQKMRWYRKQNAKRSLTSGDGAHLVELYPSKTRG